MDEAMKITDVDTIMQVPPEIAVCPICRRRLAIIAYDSWERCEDGLYKAAEVHLECETEPDFEAPEYEDWFEGHYSMPYADWLPVCKRVLAWHQAHYRFDLDGILTTKLARLGGSTKEHEESEGL